MTPEERAREIAKEFNLEGVFTRKGYTEFLEYLAAALREADAEGYARGVEEVKQEYLESQGYEVEFNKHMDYCVEICERLLQRGHEGEK